MIATFLASIAVTLAVMALKLSAEALHVSRQSLEATKQPPAVTLAYLNLGRPQLPPLPSPERLELPAFLDPDRQRGNYVDN